MITEEKVFMSFSFMNWSSKIHCYMASLHALCQGTDLQTKTCYGETRLNAQNQLTILGSIVNMEIEHLCDHSRESIFSILHLILDVENENYYNPHYLQSLSY